MRAHRHVDNRSSPAPSTSPSWLTLTFLALCGTAWLTSGCQQPAAEKRPLSEKTNHGLVIVSYDTVRRDHLSAYGYSRSTSPELESLASKGVLFTKAFTAETNTNPSHATMFTGYYPHQHGSQANGHLLRDEYQTLAETLQSNGYRTGAFVSGVPMAAIASKLDQGFEHYDDEFEGNRRPGQETTDRALSWLDSDDSRSPFLFLHLYDAHGPYQPTPAERGAFPPSPAGSVLRSVPSYQQLEDEHGQKQNNVGHYLDGYDALLLRLDQLLGEVLQAVDLETTFVLVVADHGETIDERFYQLDHGAQLFDEQIRIPMILAGPGLKQQRFDGLVETVDILPTLLALTGADDPTGATQEQDRNDPDSMPASPGRNLSGAILGTNDRQSATEFVFSAARADPNRFVDRKYEMALVNRISSVRTAEYKLIAYPGPNSTNFEFYDLVNDPGETTDVSQTNRTEVRRLLAALEEWNPVFAQPIGMVDVSDKLREQLRSLGYVQ